MNKYILLLSIFCAILFSSCGSDEQDDLKVPSKGKIEVYSASFCKIVPTDPILSEETYLLEAIKREIPHDEFHETAQKFFTSETTTTIKATPDNTAIATSH